MNLNKVAKAITLAEGGKVNMSIGQVKETLKLAMIEFSKYPASEVLKDIERTAKKYK